MLLGSWFIPIRLSAKLGPTVGQNWDPLGQEFLGMLPARTTQRLPVLAASEALGSGSGTAVPHRSCGCGHGHLVLRMGHRRKTERACTSEHQPQASSEQGEDRGWMLSARGRGRKNSLGLADPWNGKSGPSGSCRFQPCVEPWHHAPRWPCATCPCPRPARIYGEKQKCSQAGRLLPLFS